MTAETAREVKPHLTVDTNLRLLGVSLLVELLVLEAAVAQLAVVTPVRLQPLELPLGLAPSGTGLLGGRQRERRLLDWEAANHQLCGAWSVGGDFF